MSVLLAETLCGVCLGCFITYVLLAFVSLFTFEQDKLKSYGWF